MSCGPVFGFGQTECRFIAAVVIVLVDVEDSFAGA